LFVLIFLWHTNTPRYYSVICNTKITSICAAHPWLRDEKNAIPLDILIYKLVKSYVRASPLKRAALKVVTCYATMSTNASFIWQWKKSNVFCFPFLYINAGSLKSIARWWSYLP
jgi:hypothetical protein